MSQQKVNLVKELLCEMHGVYHMVIILSVASSFQSSL